jgi:D-alanyl-D-alanine carboxypeptidase (penicillin-binding protein 5/6)
LTYSTYMKAALAALTLGAAPAPVVAPPLKVPPLPVVAPAAPVDPAIPVAMLVDLSSGQTLFEREPERRFVPASVTKVMTAYTAFKLIEAGRLSLDTPVTISKEVAEMWSGEGSSMFLQAGDQVTVGQLLLGVTTVSANDASVALALQAVGSLDAWLQLMNRNAAELGMRNTRFGTPNGWPDEGRTYTSASDLALLAEALTTRFPGLYRRYFGQRGMRYRDIAQNNHDPITGVVNGADGIKTGYTRQAGYNFLGSAQRGSRRLALVIGGAPSVAVRNKASRDLMNWGFEAFDAKLVLPANTSVGEARVQEGSQRRVALVTKGDVLASVKRGEEADVTLSVRYRGPVQAPIAQGQTIAVLRVEVAGQRPHDVPLVAAEEVSRANVLMRLWNGVSGLVS